MRLYDLSGKEIKRTMLSPDKVNAEMNCSDLKAGTYLYSVYAKDKIIGSEKIVIVK